MRSLRLISMLSFFLVSMIATKLPAQMRMDEVPRSGIIVPLDSLAPDMKTANCGPYFRFDGKPNPTKELGKYGVVFFVFVSNGTTSLPMMAPDKLRIRLRKETNAPTVKVLHTGGPIYPWYEITISENDFKKASCLKESTVIPAN